MTRIAERSFDAVVLDINLQGISSSQVAAELRRLSIPFVVVSGYDPEQQRVNFPENTRFLQKPYLPSALIEALRTPAR